MHTYIRESGRRGRRISLRSAQISCRSMKHASRRHVPRTSGGEEEEDVTCGTAARGCGGIPVWPQRMQNSKQSNGARSIIVLVNGPMQDAAREQAANARAEGEPGCARIRCTANSYGFLWISMDSYGVLRIPMDSYRFL